MDMNKHECHLCNKYVYSEHYVTGAMMCIRCYYRVIGSRTMSEQDGYVRWVDL